MCNARMATVAALVVAGVATGGFGLLGAGAAGAGAAGAGAAGAAGAGAAAGSGAAAAGGMTAMQQGALAASLIGSGVSAYGQYQQGKTAQEVGKNNQIMANYAAQDALKRGEQDAMQIRRRGEALKSAQRVSLASRGLDLGYGTAADLQDHTDFFIESDIATTRTNAQRDAWGMRYRGQTERTQGQAGMYNAQLGSTGSLLGGAGQVGSQWYLYKNPGTSFAGAGG